MDADSLRRTCWPLKKLVDENYAHFRIPLVRSILLDDGRSSAEVIAVVRLEVGGRRVTRKFAGTCAQLEAKFLEFLCFSTVTDGISLRYLSDSRDGTGRDLYNLVRTLSSVVNLSGKYELRRVAVDAVHVDQWRTMFPGMKVSVVADSVAGRGEGSTVSLHPQKSLLSSSDRFTGLE